eukprot:TRINITY_DN102_c2_g1_i2.p1 TRINITY_DN102_c2_g1~~TRINITY_DN102_c2_g1_i2.p1  ORF type:complete len:260 (+),score=55.24 TRINITY_DN102_c2_g1_i2:59-838(+)
MNIIITTMALSTVTTSNLTTIGYGNVQCTETMTQPIDTCFELFGNYFKIIKGCYEEQGVKRVQIKQYKDVNCTMDDYHIKEIQHKDADQCEPYRNNYAWLMGFSCESKHFARYGNKATWSVTVNSTQECNATDGSVQVISTSSTNQCSCQKLNETGTCTKFLNCQNETGQITRVTYKYEDNWCTTPISTDVFNDDQCMRDPVEDNAKLGTAYSTAYCIQEVTQSPDTAIPDTPSPTKAGGSLAPLLSVIVSVVLLCVGL